MTSMGSASNYGMTMGMGIGKGGVGGIQAGPNVSAAGMGPSNYPPYANMGYPANPAPIAPAYVAGVGVAPVRDTTAMILVLYILLVLITRCVFI